MKEHCTCEAACDCNKPKEEKNKISKVKEENLSKRKSSKGQIGNDDDKNKIEK